MKATAAIGTTTATAMVPPLPRPPPLPELLELETNAAALVPELELELLVLAGPLCVDVTSTTEVEGLKGVPLLVGVIVTSDVRTAVEVAVSDDGSVVEGVLDGVGLGVLVD